MRIDIFCESGIKIGLGHLYRCIKLIDICAKIKQVYAITLHNRGDFNPPNISNLLSETSIESTTIEYRYYEWLSTQPKMLDLVIIDSYEAQEWFYYRMQHASKALICLDDALRDVYPPHSYILNPLPYSREQFLHKQYHLWCGEEYMIIPTFQPSKDSKQNKDGNNIFVNFGGSDSNNITQDFLNHLSIFTQTHSAFTHYCFHVVLGNGYMHKLQIPANINHMINVYHNLSPNAFLSKAQECDYAISAGGGTMLELIMLKIPSIIIESAANQKLQIAYWSQARACAMAENHLDALSKLSSWIDNAHTQKDNKDLNSIMDKLNSLSLGTLLPEALTEVANQIHSDSIEKKQDDTKALSFENLTQEQSKIVLSIRNHPQVAQWMYTTYISESSHKSFIKELKNDKSKRYWLFERDKQYIGVGSLTRINLAHRHAFIGIYTNPFCNQALKGTHILHFLESFAFESLNIHTLHLEVLSHNGRAIRFYENLGFKQEGILHHFISYRENSHKRYTDVILMYKEQV